jgi:hypothetical protein
VKVQSLPLRRPAKPDCCRLFFLAVCKLSVLPSSPVLSLTSTLPPSPTPRQTLRLPRVPMTGRNNAEKIPWQSVTQQLPEAGGLGFQHAKHLDRVIPMAGIAAREAKACAFCGVCERLDEIVWRMLKAYRPIQVQALCPSSICQIQNSGSALDASQPSTSGRCSPVNCHGSSPKNACLLLKPNTNASTPAMWRTCNSIHNSADRAVSMYHGGARMAGERDVEAPVLT